MIHELLKRARHAGPRKLRPHVEIHRTGSELSRLGWFRTREEGMCVNADGTPLPWYTYPIIAFLEPRVPKDATVFEFGMGNSTLWWAKLAAHVTACEHDQKWYDRIAPKMPANVDAILAEETSDAFTHAAVRIGKPMDILVIDGKRRVDCCRASLPLLTEGGVVIWDNAERPKYAEGYKLLEDNGFRRLDFWGMGPINIYGWLTSIFYRPNNILKI